MRSDKILRQTISEKLKNKPLIRKSCQLCSILDDKTSNKSSMRLLNLSNFQNLAAPKFDFQI